MSFLCRPLTHGRLEDFTEDGSTTAVWGWTGELVCGKGATHFGFVHEGPAALSCPAGTFSLQAGMYFAVPAALSLSGGSGLLIAQTGQHGFFHLGGPIEGRGRLRYLDGCTDSLLIPPVLRGDPCLNLLHLPPHTRQTPHTHPSLRAGLVVRGTGHCLLPGLRVPLAAGQAFAICAGGLHCFHTADSELLVVAFHPDSDFGPTDQDHPMLNRTFVAGSATPQEK
jgi:hypothetical protein